MSLKSDQLELGFSIYLSKPHDSKSVLKALPDNCDIKRHTPSISGQALQCQQAFSRPCLVNLISKDTHLVYMGKPHDSTSVLKALPA